MRWVGLPEALAAAAGAATWAGIAALGGVAEAWDSDLYYWAGLPVLAAVQFALGWAWPDGLWRRIIAAQCGQLLLLWSGPGGPGNLWPLTLALLAVFALPAWAAALLGRSAGRRSRGRSNAIDG